MKTYKVKSSAVRAAKKEFGDDYASAVDFIENADGSFSYDLKESAVQIQKELEVTALIVADEAKKDEMKAKKAEIESRKPPFIPALPIHSPVAEKTAPAPMESLPAFLQIAPPAIPAVPNDPTDFPDRTNQLSRADIQHVARHRAQEAALITAAAEAIEVFGEDELERFAEEQRRAADKIADASVANTDPLRPRVSIAKLPTKLVWDIADRMTAAAAKENSPAPKRKAVIEECVKQGIAYGTARTQYQHWFKCINDQKTAPVAVIGADGKVSFPK